MLNEILLLVIALYVITSLIFMVKLFVDLNDDLLESKREFMIEFLRSIFWPLLLILNIIKKFNALPLKKEETKPNYDGPWWE